jgi:ABC-type multidrug transport system permease subunit
MKKKFTPRRMVMVMAAVQLICALTVICVALPIVHKLPDPSASEERQEYQRAFREAVIGTGVMIPSAFAAFSIMILWIVYRKIPKENYE